MVDTATIEYEHSAAADHIYFFTRNLTREHKYDNKDTIMKDGAIKVIDSNRVQRVYSFTAQLSSTDAFKLEGYLRPGSAPDYSTAYPRFVKVYKTPTTYEENVEVVCVAFKMGPPMPKGTDWEYQVSMTFKEKTE
jgi:hypothetical protein